MVLGRLVLRSYKKLVLRGKNGGFVENYRVFRIFLGKLSAERTLVLERWIFIKTPDKSFKFLRRFLKWL